MNRPTDEQLVAIRERCDKATEGPWKEYGCYVAQDGLIVAEAHLNEAEDVEFIAHAREDIPLLLSEVKALRKLIEDITIIASENRYNASEQVLLQILMRIEEDDE